MGSLGCPASFQRLMEQVLRGLNHILIYIDDVLIHTDTHEKNYVMCMTDAFTKYAEIVAIPDKSAPVVARVLFEKWICRFGCPIEVTSDNGKEFCNQLTQELFKLLQIKHATTTPYHPQCNEQFLDTPSIYMDRRKVCPFAMAF